MASEQRNLQTVTLFTLLSILIAVGYSAEDVETTTSHVTDVNLQADVSTSEITVTDANLLPKDDSKSVSENTTLTGGFKGDLVQDGQHTYVVSVRVDGRHVNVGVIIGPEHVLTEAWHYGNCSSASCGVTIRSGTVNALKGGTIRDAVQVTAHEKYKHPHFDIAIVKVFPPFTAEEVVELPEEGHEWKFGEQATTFAWGGFSDDVLTTLLMDRLTILPEDKCSGLEDWFPKEQICTKSLRPVSGLCDGDYGAPLIVNDSIVAGINIYNSCGGPSSPPDRFVNIVPLLPWIHNHIKPSV